jgi:CRISPR-associated protein Cas1
MKQLLNTLYVMTQGAYINLDHETLKVEVEKQVQLQVPLHHLSGIFVMGNVMISPFLLGRCADSLREVCLPHVAGNTEKSRRLVKGLFECSDR